MYSKIYNPKTGRKVNVNGKVGQAILKKYINMNKIGGATTKIERIPGKYEKLYTIFSPNQILVKARQASLEGAWDLGLILKHNGLDLVTAESLTAGMIGKTIIDIPYFGASVLYGGFTVYNTDAKRLYLNVNTPSVYSQLTAEQMARGALQNSRAKVALAVTGNAMPYPEHAEAAGIVDVGLALRISHTDSKGIVKNGAIVKTIRLNLCKDEPMIAQICSHWKAEGVESDLSKECNYRNKCTASVYKKKSFKDGKTIDEEFDLSKNLSSASTPLLRKHMGKYEKGSFWEGPYARFQTTSRMAEAIRLYTVGYATKWAKYEIEELLKNKKILKSVQNVIIPKKPWDRLYLTCGEPSMHENLNYRMPLNISWPGEDCCGINGKYDPKCAMEGNSHQKSWSNNIGMVENLNHLFQQN